MQKPSEFSHRLRLFDFSAGAHRKQLRSSKDHDCGSNDIVEQESLTEKRNRIESEDFWSRDHEPNSSSTNWTPASAQRMKPDSTMNLPVRFRISIKARKRALCLPVVQLGSGSTCEEDESSDAGIERQIKIAPIVALSPAVCAPNQKRDAADHIFAGS